MKLQCCWMRVHEHLRQHREDLAGHPICGASLRTLLWRLAEHRRAGIDFFQILHNRGRFGQECAAVQFKDRDLSRRVFLQEGRRSILPGVKIYLDPLELNSLLGKIDLHAARVWGHLGFV